MEFNLWISNGYVKLMHDYHTCTIRCQIGKADMHWYDIKIFLKTETDIYLNAITENKTRQQHSDS